MASTEADVAQPLQEDINSLQQVLHLAASMWLFPPLLRVKVLPVTAQEVDKKVLRPAHKQSFTCSAKCCDKNTAPEEFQKCLEVRPPVLLDCLSLEKSCGEHIATFHLAEVQGRC